MGPLLARRSSAALETLSELHPDPSCVVSVSSQLSVNAAGASDVERKPVCLPVWEVSVGGQWRYCSGAWGEALDHGRESKGLKRRGRGQGFHMTDWQSSSWVPPLEGRLLPSRWATGWGPSL